MRYIVLLSFSCLLAFGQSVKQPGGTANAVTGASSITAANHIPYSSGTGQISLDLTAGKQFYRDTNGNLVVGSTTLNGAKVNIVSTAEQLRLYYDSTFYGKITVDSAGKMTFDNTHTSKYFQFGVAGFVLVAGAVTQFNHTNAELLFQNATFNGTSGSVHPVKLQPYFSPSSGSMTLNAFSIQPTINQTGTASGSYRALHVNVTRTAALGTANYLAWFGIGGAAKFTVDEDGNAATQGNKLATLNACLNAQTGNSYTLAATDNGCVLTFNNASDVTLTVPAGLGAGFNVTIVQLGAGQVTPTVSGTSIVQRQSFTKTAGTYATASLIAYVANTFVLSGDLQ